ncbi:MAG: chemotaxis protein CheD [Solirubrobacterales bacterium]
MGASELMVRMGELAVSATPGDVLVTIGLGSCIGVALLDARRPIVGLAHIMLPDGPSAGPEAKFADPGVPLLANRVKALGAARLEAVIVGGAQMFSFSGEGGGNIGARNEAAVRDQLGRLSIPIRAASTGGNKGRTVRVHVDGVRVTVREVAAVEEEVYAR